MKPLAMGVDIGTTSVKVALLDTKTKQIKKTASRETHASIHSDLGTLGNEQEPHKILTALQHCVSGLPKDLLLQVGRIGISGQMHGLVLWKRSNGWSKTSLGRYDVEESSRLFTWQDGRCTADFLATLPKPESHLRLATGFGCATLFWLHRNRVDFVEQYDCAGTIQDFIVAMICDLDKPVMSVHNAASWGYFDTVNSTWNKQV